MIERASSVVIALVAALAFHASVPVSIAVDAQPIRRVRSLIVDGWETAGLAIISTSGQCPLGSSEHTQLRGRFPLGAVDAGSVGESVGMAMSEGELRLGGSYQDINFTAPSISYSAPSVTFTPISITYERPSISVSWSNASAPHTHRYGRGFVYTISDNAGIGQVNAITGVSSGFSTGNTQSAPSSLSGGSATLTGGGVSFDGGSLTFSGGSASLSGGSVSDVTDKLPPAPYITVTYCTFG